MNRYTFYVSDYTSHTAHLEPMEDLAYRRMLDLYYMREGPLPADAQEVARLIRMRQYTAEVESVLREFFALCDDGWRHARCDEEIAKMADRQAKARASAAASVSARRTLAQRALSKRSSSADRAPNERLANAQRTLSERSTDAEQPAAQKNKPTQESDDTAAASPRKRAASPALDAPEDVSEQVWADFVAHRKAKKAPVTQTVIDNFRAEARKAGISLEEALRTCCALGWQGFRAEWLGRKNSTTNQRNTAAPMDKAARDEQAMRLLGFDIIDMEAP